MTQLEPHNVNVQVSHIICCDGWVWWILR